ncbi:MAG: C-terminal binding protein [Lachnospiraceae bacterium]|jgi:D-3-phosphoglycerate dehydrogenase|nr:C-terminal binding protein [Lachnospiraceae bacterium]
MKVIIIDCDQDSVDIEMEVFKKAGIEATLKNIFSEDEIIKECSEADIFIVQFANITEKIMRSCPNLKCIIRYGVGVDNVDVKAATALGIQVGNVPDYGMNEVADHAISLALALTRKIVIMNDFTKQEKWDYIKSIPIHRYSEMIVGVIGLGRIGRNFAKKMSALGFKVIGSDPHFKSTEETEKYVQIVSFDELITKSDIISIHIPADGNIDLFNYKVFERMKNTSIIINVARGGIINEKDLDKALQNGEIAGAGIDCMLGEPVSKNNPLFQNENLIVTPHMAWYSEEAALELKRKVAEEAVRFAKGEEICYKINEV